jgi:hypothetical protein
LEYNLTRGGRRWTLQLDSDGPGLCAADQPRDQILTLGGIAAIGRFDPNALSHESLVGADRSGDRVEARFAPSGWGGLQVRASWSLPERLDGIDLEVEALALSVGELKGVEVFVSSHLADAATPLQEPQHLWVTPRDARSAVLSYDGREPAATLARLTTEPVPDSMDPSLALGALFGPPVGSGRRYLELVHPHDVARRIIEGPDSSRPTETAALAVRYGLFGHDLEKGVIVRGRLRGLWLGRKSAAAAPRAAFRAFLQIPPPLGR